MTSSEEKNLRLSLIYRQQFLIDYAQELLDLNAMHTQEVNTSTSLEELKAAHYCKYKNFIQMIKFLQKEETQYYLPLNLHEKLELVLKN
ncbi:hypothetical protein GAMM_200036 [Gammaproteobacteria bacterium]